MRAAVLYDVDDVRVEERAVPALQEGEMLVRTQASGICSSDIMAWYVKRKAPLVLGHEPAGIVAAIGDGDAPRADDGTAFAVGDRVFVHHHAPCFACAHCERGDYVQCATWRSTKIEPGGIAEYFRVGRQNARDTLRLPDGVPFADASLVEPLACVVKGLRRAHVRDGDTVYVIGLGMMGLMHVLALGSMGSRIRIVASDFIAERRAFARQYGAETIHPDEAKALLINAADKVFCLPGSPEAMRAAFAAVAPGGTVVMFTPFEPDAVVPIDPEQFYFRDLTLVASYSCGPDDTRSSLQLIEGGIVTAEKLGATLLALDDVAQAYRDLRGARITKPIVCFP
jgi:L-iditol 2-dehydrogenase